MRLTVELKAQSIGDELNNVVDRFEKALQQELITELRRNTPKDTGRARAGWRSGGLLFQRSVINTVPYIVLLEKGRSSQAPRGFLNQSLRLAIIRATRIII